MKFIVLPFVLICALNQGVSSQGNIPVKKYLDLVYNMDFSAAQRLLDQYAVPNSSNVQLETHLLKAYLLRWKYLPITDSSASYKSYETLLDEVIEQSTKALKVDPDGEQALYYKMTAHLMKAELFMNNGSFTKAVFEGKMALSGIKKGFSLIEENFEFYISTGLYNYYIEFYRNKGFFYSSLLWPFPKGDQQLGLQYLQEGYEHATFSSTEALIYLTHINFKLENKPYTALNYSKELLNKYPDNLKFIELRVENLIACKMYSEALLLNKKLLDSPNKYFSTRGQLFEGILQYQAHNNSSLALRHLEEAQDENYLDEHLMSLLFLKKGEICSQTGSKEEARNYLNRSKKLAKYEYIKEELKKKS